MSKPEPRFGDVYQWRAGGQKVMVICDDPLAFVLLNNVHGLDEIGRVTSYSSNEQRVPFSTETNSWIRVEGA